jgi:DNA-binding response OmpR family regulator
MNAPSNHKTTLGRILLVEGEPVVLHVVAEALRTAGYEVGTARDGAEGLREFEATSWDVVVTDRGMPNLSGEEMASAIRALNPKVSVILITGLPCSRAATGLFDAVLSKPFRSAHLLSVLASVFSYTPQPYSARFAGSGC